jgi:hypothetical protein
MARVSNAALLAAAEREGVTPPQQTTLDKYGLTVEEWLRMLMAQGWVCPICEKGQRRWNTDHEHVAGWAKLPPEERKKYVRGVLCWHCNHKIVSNLRDSGVVQRVANYLKAYEERKAESSVG